jgi:gluconate 2-dehydrogenase gamma chain
VTDDSMNRRRFLVAAGTSGAALANVLATTLPPVLSGCAIPQAGRPSLAAVPAVPLGANHAPPPPPAEPALSLNATEYAFVDAAVDTLIPQDELSPSGSACGVTVFIDRQLAGAFGNGARLYRQGPFAPGKPEHGYQLPLTPREFFRAGIAATNELTQRTLRKPFDGLSADARARVLSDLEHGTADLNGVNGQAFFEALLSLTMEGFFADPMYGGNRDKIAWKMVGYPGLPATYEVEIRKYRGLPFAPEPKSIADFT